jgi:2C-methyl-D-erythritol 2,4-cyclodiphosphate synthase
LSLTVADVCITATSGEGLNACGRGEGIHATVIVTAVAD